MSLARRVWTHRPGWHGLVALILVGLYFLLLAILAILRHQSFHSFGLDLGLFDQVIWNTTQGRPLESTMSLAQATPHSLLGDHFSPLLLALAPFYALYPHPETLLVVQSLALALGAWPVYLLARLKLGPAHAVAWVLVYMLFIPVAYIDLDDFHEIALAVAPLGFALYFLETSQRARLVTMLLVALLVKEEIPIIVVGFGAYALLGKRDWRLGLSLIAGAVVAFAVVIGVVIPHFALSSGYHYITDRYGYIGGTPLGILKTAVTDPLRIVRALLVPKKLYFLIAIFGPVLGLSAVAGWAVLVVLAPLSYLLLTNDVAQYSFTTQYSAPLIPLAVGTAIIGASRAPRVHLVKVTGAVLVSSLIFSWAFGYLPFSRRFDPALFETPSRYDGFTASLNQIPPGASVSVEDNLTSHLSERRYIYDFGFEGSQDAQWLVLDAAGVGSDQTRFDAQVQAAESQGYVLVATGEGLALLRKQSA